MKALGVKLAEPAHGDLPEGLSLRRFSPLAPRGIVIGASTGGPQALAAVLERLSPHADAIPIFIVLHMPNDFASVVSGYLERLTQRATSIAEHGEAAKPGHIYIAPGNSHLRLFGPPSGAMMALHDGPPENFCKPAVDVLFRSAAKVYGMATLGVVLSGMGADGLNGARVIAEAGGSIIVQDAATSVVWGMPGAVALDGLASAILPVTQIGDVAAGLLRGIRPGVRP